LIRATKAIKYIPTHTPTGLRRWIRVARRWSPGVRFLAGSSFSLGGVSCLPVHWSSLLGPVVLGRRRSRLSLLSSVPFCASASASRSVVPGALTRSFSLLSSRSVVSPPPFRSSPWVGPRGGVSGVGLLLGSFAVPLLLGLGCSGAPVVLSPFRSPAGCALALALVSALPGLLLLLAVVALSSPLFRAASPLRVGPGLPPVWRCALVCRTLFFRLVVRCHAFRLSAGVGSPPVPVYGRGFTVWVSVGFRVVRRFLARVCGAGCRLPGFFGSLLSISAPDSGYVACGLQASNTVTTTGLSPISK